MKVNDKRHWRTALLLSITACVAMRVANAQEAHTTTGNNLVAAPTTSASEAGDSQRGSGEDGVTAESPQTSDEATAGAKSQSGESTLGEVIVTARRRKETLMDTPVVETVITQASLKQYQTNDLFMVEQQVPGLLLSNDIAVIAPTVSLRGIGTVAVNSTMDQSVSLNIDGLQLSQGYAYTAGLFDDGQISVLKGPQALYFGKNSPAGVISVTTADPTDKTEAILTGGYEAISEGKLGEMILSGPVTDWLKLRLAVQDLHDNGYFRNFDTAPAGDWGVVTPGTTHTDITDSTITRLTALLNPSPVYSARLKFNYTNDRSDHSSGFQFASCPNGKAGYLGLPLTSLDDDCTVNRYVMQLDYDPKEWPGLQNDGVPFFDSHQDFGTLEQTFHLPYELDVTSITGYYSFNQDTLVNGSGNSGAISLAADNDFGTDETTEELRLSSNFTDIPVNFMAGAYYQNGRMENDVLLYGNTILGLPQDLQGVHHIIDIHSISGFGQLTWNITKKLELDAGARWTSERRTHTQVNVATPGVPLGVTPLLDPYLSYNNVSPQATLTFRPTDDLTIYGAYRTGFKSGSFNSVEYYSPTTPTSFGEEKVKGGEVGVKSRLLDHHLFVELTGYYYRYNGLQVGADEVGPGGEILLYTQNAASAEIRGVDFDAAYAPPGLQSLTLRSAVEYNRATYVTFPNAPCDNDQTISQGCNQLYDSETGSYTAQNLAGRPLAAAPEWAANAGFDYEVPVGPKMALTLGSTVSYTSRFYTAILDLPAYLQGGYTEVSSNIALNGPDDKWQVALIGNNLTDKVVAGSYCSNANPNNAAFLGGQQSGKATGGPSGTDAPDCAADPGRVVWLRVSWRPLGM